MKPVIDPRVLKLIDDVTNRVIARMRRGEKLFGEKVTHQEFTKYPVLQEKFQDLLEESGAAGLKRNDLDIDVVAVHGLQESNHVHRHPLGHALTTCLSVQEGWENPRALHYIRKPGLARHADIMATDWIPFVPGDRVLFYPNVPHGLKGTGFILSVQSSSIEGHDERADDWDLLP